MLILSGLLSPSHGAVRYYEADQEIPVEEYYIHQSIVAPYEELIEEFTLQELLDFHFSLKPPLNGITKQEIIQAMYLEPARHKYIRQFSSGMKQRLKLGLAFYSHSQILFLDEPCSNLDARGIQWYKQEVSKVASERIVLVCSNQPYEYEFVKHKIDIEQYK
jgi:ABC-type multidrug transport system ATPase subunit